MQKIKKWLRFFTDIFGHIIVGHIYGTAVKSKMKMLDN